MTGIVAVDGVPGCGGRAVKIIVVQSSENLAVVSS